MTMQTDVKSAHLGASGWFIANDRVRIKGLSLRGTANAGKLSLFATDTAPVTASYGQSGTTITVTSNSHGLSTGDLVGIAYAKGTGGSASCGNSEITVTDANTFTITCFNSFTITGSPACYYVVGDNNWLATFSTAATDIYNNYFLLPGQGILSNKKPYGNLVNIDSAFIFYG